MIHILNDSTLKIKCSTCFGAKLILPMYPVYYIFNSLLLLLLLLHLIWTYFIMKVLYRTILAGQVMLNIIHWGKKRQFNWHSLLFVDGERQPKFVQRGFQRGQQSVGQLVGFTCHSIQARITNQCGRRIIIGITIINTTQDFQIVVVVVQSYWPLFCIFFSTSSTKEIRANNEYKSSFYFVLFLKEKGKKNEYERKVHYRRLKMCVNLPATPLLAYSFRFQNTNSLYCVFDGPPFCLATCYYFWLCIRVSPLQFFVVRCFSAFFLLFVIVSSLNKVADASDKTKIMMG